MADHKYLVQRSIEELMVLANHDWSTVGQAELDKLHLVLDLTTMNIEKLYS